jgi:hypothetical protein
MARRVKSKRQPAAANSSGSGREPPRASARSVLAESAPFVPPGIGPDLQRAQLRNAVFDVVKRMQKDMELAMPQIRARLLVAAPIHLAAKAVHQGEPGLPPLGPAVARMRVQSNVERRPRSRSTGKWRRCLPDDRAARAGRRPRIKSLHVLVAQQFHAHRGDFAKFNRRAAVGVQFLPRAARA